jgi:tetratricopeptide (TPR) repeat protein
VRDPQLTAQEHFAQAVALHQQGKLAEAAPHYAAMLAEDPGNFAALHNLGILRARLGEVEAALALIRRALELQPDSAEAHNSLGNALVAAGRHQEAVAAFSTAVSLKPDLVQAHNNLGNALQALGRYEAAIECYDRALDRAPSYAEAYENLGRALGALGQHHEAVIAYEKAIELKPDQASCHNNFGTSLQALHRYEEAILSYEKALQLKPDFPEAYNNLANTMLALKRREEAIGYFDKALALKPDFAEVHNNRGNVLSALGRHEEAVACFEAALACKPGLAEAHCDLANALAALDRFEEAEAHLRQALAARPDMAIAYNNLGGVLWEMHRYEEALRHYETALALQPDYVDANFNLSIVLLQLGRFDPGWRQGEWRLVRAAKESPPRRFLRSLWMGEGALGGQTILLHAEQGLGDTIQFARYAPMLAERGARVILEVQKPLVPLLRGMRGVASVHAAGDEPPDFDRHCPLMSMACALRTTLDTVPAEIPYIAPDAARVEKWRPVIEALGRPRIGLVWSGNRDHKNDRHRSMTLEQLRPLLAISGLHFVVLQRDLRERDALLLTELPGITVPGERLEDFADTAAIASMLDLVISVDTSVAHLAGAMGKPLWLLLPFAPDWRWLLEREDSPWYPSARLFRQPARWDWESVIARICGAAAALR